VALRELESVLSVIFIFVLETVALRLILPEIPWHRPAPLLISEDLQITHMKILLLFLCVFKFWECPYSIIATGIHSYPEYYSQNNRFTDQFHIFWEKTKWIIFSFQDNSHIWKQKRNYGQPHSPNFTHLHRSLHPSKSHSQLQSLARDKTCTPGPHY